MSKLPESGPAAANGPPQSFGKSIPLTHSAFLILQYSTRYHPLQGQESDRAGKFPAGGEISAFLPDILRNHPCLWKGRGTLTGKTTMRKPGMASTGGAPRNTGRPDHVLGILSVPAALSLPDLNIQASRRGGRGSGRLSLYFGKSHFQKGSAHKRAKDYSGVHCSHPYRSRPSHLPVCPKRSQPGISMLL